jgi:hypothetical protein
MVSQARTQSRSYRYSALSHHWAFTIHGQSIERIVISPQIYIRTIVNRINQGVRFLYIV